mmetsp:Transcript_20805/g.30798  ORF Transcript_20805/g.30798 Transcript_20805/m.30798 type:complete len:147 (+) Transcript_20805:1854-2294(+)
MISQALTIFTRSKPFAMLRRIFCSGNLKDYTNAIVESPSVWNDLTCGVVTQPPIPNWIVLSSESDFFSLEDDDDLEEDDSVWNFESPIEKIQDDKSKGAPELTSSTDEDFSNDGSSYALTPNSWQSSSVESDESTVNSWDCGRVFL